MLKFLKCRESRSFEPPRKPHARVLANVLTRNHAVRIVPYSEHYLYLNSVSPSQIGIHTVGTLSHHDIDQMFDQCDIIPYQDNFICLVPGRVGGSLHVTKDFISVDMALTGSINDVRNGRCADKSWMVPEDKAVFNHLRDYHPDLIANMGILIRPSSNVILLDEMLTLNLAYWDNKFFHTGAIEFMSTCTDPIIYL